MDIGSVTLKNNLILAPMAGISDIAFRILCKRYGAGLVFTEMINVNALDRSNKATIRLTKTCDEEKPVAFQLFGTRKDPLISAVKSIEGKADIIDFNLGCPAQQIIDQGAGAALLKRPTKIKEIISILVKNSSKPITVKMRSGVNEENKQPVKTAKLIEEAGASAITIHPRTVKQGYSGKADWNIIKQIKEAVSIPVIGNGDVTNGKQAEAMLKMTKCDGVMIGRAAIGDPHIFYRVQKYLETKEIIPMPTKKEKVKQFFEYAELAEKFDILNSHLLMQRAQEFTRNLRNSNQLRAKLNNAKTVEEIKKEMRRFEEDV
ncbi:tRNA dihydrouridine synthase DusB [Candidatus Woesearchaeota archaeon]|nr:tRNA dihydrouridine synthase DusB [Candidatus Woesearchaeota archaeon]